MPPEALDAWGHAPHLEDREGRRVLVSYGADDEPGGVGDAADLEVAIDAAAQDGSGREPGN